MEMIEVASYGLRFSVVRDSREVGRAYLYVMTNDLHSEPFGLMEDVWVSPDHRGRHIGSELVKAVIAQAREKQCYKLIATSRYSRPKVHTLYKKLGFTDHGVEFRMNFSE